MENFEKLLQEVKTIAKSITKEEFEQTLEEYEKIQSKRSDSMEIEVGEWVRNKNGVIIKVDWVGHAIVTDVKDITIPKNDIVKHSKNLIDLIEYRDLIKFKNSIKVSTIKDDKEKEIKFLDAYFCDGFMDYEGNEDTFILYNLDYVINTKNIKNEDIDYLLTYEQIVQHCYRLEE